MIISMQRSLRLPLIVLAMSASFVSGSSAFAAKPDILSNVLVIGASASAGYGTKSEIGGESEDVKLAELFTLMIKSKKAKVSDLSDLAFFMSPLETGTALKEIAVKQQPSCLIAIDYLFWFGYGQLETLELRQERLAKGLQMLEDFECPLLISKLPNMKRAVGRILSQEQVPSAEDLKVLNEMITKWAKPRKNVHFVPLGEALDSLYNGKIVRVGKTKWQPPKALTVLMQSDKLHPTITGLAMTATLTLDTMVKKKLIKKSKVKLDPKQAAKKLISMKKQEDA